MRYQFLDPSYLANTYLDVVQNFMVTLIGTGLKGAGKKITHRVTVWAGGGKYGFCLVSFDLHNEPVLGLFGCAEGC